MFYIAYQVNFYKKYCEIVCKVPSPASVYLILICDEKCFQLRSPYKYLNLNRMSINMPLCFFIRLFLSLLPKQEIKYNLLTAVFNYLKIKRVTAHDQSKSPPQGNTEYYGITRGRLQHWY